ncbi:MAG: DUF5724 domain-containing protein [Treponema sp.]|jgi:hypothetical protein|nr:DUF5724 domain-containing protein [Treponema sp.]
MDKDAIIEKALEQQGRPGEVAKALIRYEQSRRNRAEAVNVLTQVLLKGSPKTWPAVFDRGPRQLFTAVHGEAVADWVAQMTARMHRYVHSPSAWRRSFRSKALMPYRGYFLGMLRECFFFPWEDFHILKALTGPAKDEPRLSIQVYGDLLALHIDEGDEALIAAITDICLGDNNTMLLSDALIHGIVKSQNLDLYRLLGDLLLAAKLQEGLRQSILESADNGRVEAFIYLLKLVLDNDLLRYSSALRALDVWMGLGETFEDKRVAQKLLTLGYTYLSDPQALKAGSESADVTEIYAALWAASVREMDDALSLVDTLLQGEKYRKLVALYFLMQTENPDLQSAAAAKLLTDTPKPLLPVLQPKRTAGNEQDLDVLSLAMRNYLRSYTGWHTSAQDFSLDCKQYRVLENPRFRDRQFAALTEILPRIPAAGYRAEGKPFPWCTLALSPQDVFTRLFIIAGYDFDAGKIAQLRALMPQADPDSRAFFIRLFLETPDPQSRAFVFAALHDKSMSVRSQALKRLLEWPSPLMSEEEEKAIQDLLVLKTGDLRQNGVKLLLSLPDERPLEAAKTLLTAKSENKRLAGLDMLNQLVQSEKLPPGEAAALLALIPAPSDKELLLMASLRTEKLRYCKANGFGLYDPDYLPVFPLPQAHPEHSLAGIFGFSPQRILGIFDALCQRIRENRDYTYTVHTYEGDEEAPLGGLVSPRARAEVHDQDSLPAFEKFVLHEVWRGWIREQGVSFKEILLFKFMEKMEDYHGRYEPDYPQGVKRIIQELFHAKELDQCLVSCHKREYSSLALHIICILDGEYAEAERCAVISGALAGLVAGVSEADWKQPLDEEDGQRTYYRSNRDRDTFGDTQELRFLLEELQKAAATEEHFKTYTAFCFILGRLSGLFYRHMEAVEVARAVDLGFLTIDALYRTMFLSGTSALDHYAGKIRWDRYKKDMEQYPLLKKTADEAAARVIEIELQRGDSATEVSHLALNINRHEGAETFAKILVALGRETLVRGYIYSGSDKTKQMALSHLLKTCYPKPQDSAETLRAALAGKISDKRLIEAAMYAPAWIDIVGDYLGWPGLKSAVWYFHAHINESFSAEKETQVARYSPITAEAFNDGAFDITWFRDAYAVLGEARFSLVYDCAKYLSSGANHRRAQLFADAVLGKLTADTLWQEAHEKRNRDKLLSYSLIPLEKGREQEDTLKRYENIQLFLKESKSFGAQRRASEGKACAIALENLGRNAGFSDSLRFTWRMETRKIESLRGYFENKSCGEYQVRVVINEGGEASLVCEKKGKTFASLPAALKKDPYVLACKETAAALKAQYKRTRENLERIMVNRDTFPFGEIKALMDHPVVAPLLSKLVFVSLKDQGGEVAAAGTFCELADALEDARLVRVAHPFDLYILGRWLDYQHYAFEHKLVQPFKQIFRELYLLNEDEKAAKTVSRRYAGHQVQPKKTLALLKSRGWTVDYEAGLQRVYYRENLYVKLYAAADWFSPADIEAPSLETVEFFDRKTHKAVLLEHIPPVIFSEVMRDIDLVVSVAHVGGVDPEASHSTVEMRAGILRELLQILHITNVSVEGRHAKILGTLGEYTLHLGSAQVHKLGRGAVNILAVPSQHRGRVFLPFADDDPRTAEVMSKVILLAEDRTIKDPAILAQLE